MSLTVRRLTCGVLGCEAFAVLHPFCLGNNCSGQIMLFEMLTARLPFTSGTNERTRARIMQGTTVLCPTVVPNSDTSFRQAH